MTLLAITESKHHVHSWGRGKPNTHDDRHLLKRIEWEAAQIEDRSYNDAGSLTGVDRTYVDETRTYNAGSQLTQISSTNVGSQTYTYDLNELSGLHLYTCDEDTG